MMAEYGGSGFARFMELRGYRVAEAAGVLWHRVAHGMYMSFPYHREVDLHPAEAPAVVRAIGALGIRYPSRQWHGLPSGLYVCRRKDYDQHALHRNFRAHVKKGLPFCEVRPLVESELMTQALAINRETMRRQNRYDPEFGDAGRWKRMVSAMQESPCIAAVGAFVDGHLASYGITCCEGGWIHILHKMNSFEFDNRHASQVLDFTITRRISLEPGIEAVSMGLYPLINSNPGLHEYKLRLGYDFERFYSVIRLRPWVEAFGTSWASLAAVALARRTRRLDQRLEMVEGVLRAVQAARSGLAPASARDEGRVGTATGERHAPSRAESL